MISLKIKELNAAGSSRSAKNSSGSVHKLSESQYNDVAKEASKRGMAFNSMKDYGCRIFKYIQKNAGSRMVTVKNQQTGEDEQIDVLTAMANSYDSVLDTVLDVKLEELLGSGSWNVDWFREGTSNSKIAQLKAAGIDVKILDGDSRVYTFSLIDAEGNVIQDENGKFAQVIKADLGIPDGFFQETERNMALILDAMGYNCLTALDFTEEEMSMIKELAQLDNSQLGESSGKKVSDIYSKASVGQGSVFGKGGGKDGVLNLTQEEIDLYGIDPYTEILDTQETDTSLTQEEQEEDSNEEETDKTKVSREKYNAMIESKTEEAAEEYEDKTGLEAATYQMRKFRKEAEQEVSKKYAVV